MTHHELALLTPELAPEIASDRIDVDEWTHCMDAIKHRVEHLYTMVISPTIASGYIRQRLADTDLDAMEKLLTMLRIDFTPYDLASRAVPMPPHQKMKLYKFLVKQEINFLENKLLEIQQSFMTHMVLGHFVPSDDFYIEPEDVMNTGVSYRDVDGSFSDLAY